MIDRATAPEDPEPPAPEMAEDRTGRVELPVLSEEPAGDDDSAGVSLEQRVCRLEEAVAGLQDTQQLETRIAGRVLDRVHGERAAPTGVRQAAGAVFDAGRQLLPVAVGALQAHAAAAEAQARAEPEPPRRPWLIVDLYADARTLARMCRDPLYRTVWLGRALLPLGLLAIILTSGIWRMLLPPFNLLPDFMAGLLVKLVDLSLAFVLCKVLQREIRRYREIVPDPAPARRP